MEKIAVEICVGTSCHLYGALDLAQVLEEVNMKYPERLEIISRTCLGNCDKGPNVRLAGKLLERITPEELRNIIIQLVQKKEKENE
ncbi:MAG: (2Fe-2S) ferredoxin protein [Peptococcaceae bacterium]|jgi:NADH:ubiquinone oxidoreductase subunit E|nr:(2Fe-2S) ferredoxin protein [Peptococcaceae bacterium]